MKKIEIGTATIHYAQDGKVTHTSFIPKEIDLPLSSIEGLRGIPSSASNTELQENANKVFAAWFEHMNEVELADRDKYEIASAVHCKRREDNTISECWIAFFFQEIQIKK